MDGGKEQEGLIDREKQRSVWKNLLISDPSQHPQFQDRSRAAEECHTGQETGVNPRRPHENPDKVHIQAIIIVRVDN